MNPGSSFHLIFVTDDSKYLHLYYSILAALGSENIVSDLTVSYINSASYNLHVMGVGTGATGKVTPALFLFGKNTILTKQDMLSSALKACLS